MQNYNYRERFLRLKNMNLSEIKFIKSEIKILDEEKFLKAIFEK